MSVEMGYEFCTPKPTLRLGVMLAVLLLVQACDGRLPHLPPTASEIAETSKYVSVPLNTIWVYAPGAQAALERGLLNGREQRIALPNRTTAPGDNELVLLARYFPGPETGRLQYGEFLHQVGGLPEPFQAMSSGDLLTGTDALGTYFWAEKRIGENTVCVLGLRRLGVGIRQMPDNSSVIDVMLRNCVNGSAQDALKPITAANIANYPGGSTAMAPDPIRMLSPLAGPTPQ